MTLHLDDARWRAAVEAELTGDGTAEQAEFLATYLPQGEEHRAEQALLAALAAADDADGTQGSDADDRAVAEALATFARVEPATPRRRRGLWIAVGLAAAVAVAMVSGVALRSGDEAPLVARGTLARLPELPTPRGPESQPERNAVAQTWHVESGSVAVDGAKAAGEALPKGVPMVATERVCARRDAASACWDKGSRFETRVAGDSTLLRGRVELQSAQRLDIAGVSVMPRVGSLVIVERSTAGWSVQVERGSAAVSGLEQDRVVLAGETLRRGPRTKPAETSGGPSGGELLRRAREQRRAGDRKAALATYARILRRFSGSAAAQAAAVSSGQLHLQAGRPEAALRAFRRYRRKGGGALAQDAAYGEIQALRKLGRTRDADRAREAFIKRYPSSHYAAKLRR